jgi:hypothetical protein
VKALIVLVALVGLAAQEPEHRDDKYREDPHARCMRPEVVEFYPENKSLHACSCHQTCAYEGTENQYVQEDPKCSMYCSSQRCGCHHDENPCGGSHVEPGK